MVPVFLESEALLETRGLQDILGLEGTLEVLVLSAFLDKRASKEIQASGEVKETQVWSAHQARGVDRVCRVFLANQVSMALRDHGAFRDSKVLQDH